MNYRILGNVSSGLAGAALVTVVASFMDFPGASLESASLLLLTSLIGFGVSRFYQITDHLVSTTISGGTVSGDDEIFRRADSKQ